MRRFYARRKPSETCYFGAVAEIACLVDFTCFWVEHCVDIWVLLPVGVAI